MLSVPIKTLDDGSVSLHATTIGYNQKALVIAGPSGAGKSSLALRMLSLGAVLISDDLTVLSTTPTGIAAHSPTNAIPLIEVRGLGLLNVPVAGGGQLHTILDLGTPEAERMPPPRRISILGQNAPLLCKPATPHLAEAMIHYLHYGRSD